MHKWNYILQWIKALKKWNKTNKTCLVIQLNHGASKGMNFGHGSPNWMLGELPMQDGFEIDRVDGLQLLLTWVPGNRKGFKSIFATLCAYFWLLWDSVWFLNAFLQNVLHRYVCGWKQKDMRKWKKAKLFVKCTYPTLKILTTDVKRDVSLCRPRLVPAFMLATICTPSRPTHSRFES